MGDNGILNLLGALVALAIVGMICAFSAGFADGATIHNEGTINQCRFSVNSCNEVNVEQQGDGNVAAVASGGSSASNSTVNQVNFNWLGGVVVIVLAMCVFLLLVAGSGAFDNKF